ncbi:glutathione S-transferase [Dendryphion nanum]|uniref:Glutathione S-transferase n=1 Tax=Dendryphion nanum TaxID=256645 RepID=A0A9P9DRU9_9PLEO|nr:glutathione S-transferase [Dendryphion nanum]
MSPFATLYSTTSFVHARATKSLAIANINSLDLYVDPNFAYGTTNKTPAFLSKFPHGKIPALETPSGFCLSESTAIALYLAESGPAKDQLIGRTIEERALVQMWISLADTDIWLNAGAVLGPISGSSKYYPEEVENKEFQFNRALQRIEEHLGQEGKVWLVRDDEFSLADLSVASSLYWPLKIFMDKEYQEKYPKLMGWWDRLMGIEKVAKGFHAPITFCDKRPLMDGSWEGLVPKKKEEVDQE